MVWILGLHPPPPSVWMPKRVAWDERIYFDLVMAVVLEMVTVARVILTHLLILSPELMLALLSVIFLRSCYSSVVCFKLPPDHSSLCLFWLSLSILSLVGTKTDDNRSLLTLIYSADYDDNSRNISQKKKRSLSTSIHLFSFQWFI